MTSLLSVSVGNSLTRNETTLPSNFINSSLISVGKLTSLNINGNTINNGNLTISGALQSPMTSLLSVSVGNSLTRNETTLPSNFINSSLISVGTLTSLNITGNTINNGNLTISGTLQSPMTSLLSVSVVNSLTRNETTLPSNFINSSLISVGTLTSLNITGNTINNGNLTISGTLQSPMTSLLSVSVGNSLTRNETTLPSNFINSS